jgi:hypothetical protein
MRHVAAAKGYELMDKARIEAWLIEPMRSLEIDLSPAARAVAVSLVMAWIYEHEETDLSISPWSDVPRWVDAAMQGDEAAVSHLQILEQHFGQKPPLTLVAADADQIQPYVFESAKIPEVRGASALVERLNLKGLEQVIESLGLLKQVIVYRGGGGAMLLVPSVVADRVCRAIEELFVARTHVASITTVSRAVSLRDLMERDSFRKVRSALMHDLQIRKLEKESPSHYEWLPFARRCQACEVRPASEIYEQSADRPLLCEACYVKREEGRVRRLPLRFEDFLAQQFRNGHVPPYLEDVGLNLVSISGDQRSGGRGDLQPDAQSPVCPNQSALRRHQL